MNRSQLKALKALLTEDTWSKGIYYARAHDGTIVRPSDPNAARFSLAGAVWAATDFHVQPTVTHAIIKHITHPDHASRFQILIQLVTELKHPNETLPQIFSQFLQTTWDDMEAVLNLIPVEPNTQPCPHCGQTNMLG